MHRSAFWQAVRVFAFSGVLVAGCAGGPQGGADKESAARRPDPFSSNHATLVDLAFDGELVAPAGAKPEKYIEDQLFYTVGQLNAHASVGRLDDVALSGIETQGLGNGTVRIAYHAVLPVGWGETGAPPPSVHLALPRRTSPAGLSAFAAHYASSCVEESGHQVTPANFWYHFRPEAPGCTLDPIDVVSVEAALGPNDQNTSCRYPEYHRIWEDGALHVVAVFAKYDVGATSLDDPGIAAYDEFLSRLPVESGLAFESAPAALPANPGTSVPDVTFSSDDGERRVIVNALLIDSPLVAGKAFDARFAELTKDADVIAYSGHAGLGANVHALAEKGTVTPGKYQLVYLNGCDTFAYLDDRLAERRAAANPDDPSGTKYLNVVTNLTPAYFEAMPSAALALVQGLLDTAEPKTYPALLESFGSDQVVVVTGEEDNVFAPGPLEGWTGATWSGAVSLGEMVRYQTPVLPPGSYSVSIAGDPKHSGGDVDLYVGVGFAPSFDVWTEAPYLEGSDEEVTVTLDEPGALHLMLYGYAPGPSGKAWFVLQAQPGG